MLLQESSEERRFILKSWMVALPRKIQDDV